MGKKKVDNGHCRQYRDRRHKCTSCNKVRFEKFLTNAFYYEGGEPMKTRYGNEVWFCVDNPDCLQDQKEYRPY